jgi:hypothetical protein
LTQWLIQPQPAGRIRYLSPTQALAWATLRPGLTAGPPDRAFSRREIKAGEQLTISYDYTGEGTNPRKKSWFEIHNVEKVEIDPTNNKRRHHERRH